MTIEKEIQNYKDRLIRKAKRSGLWENFGQEEVNVLESKYSECQYSREDADKKIWQAIRAFDTWCMNYTGE